ncbi:hypothetical protein CWE09_03260 [Aliidiomarina minuta]|uniref:Lipoprotein SmpA/OmlA domain-containing protein n=1 Tax=Aliidiomarina minuta TaxID=880057 RepID=A0A432W6V1_9GAMM|nr:outer membrane protein assembly factor BamE [Aliidiomarina minuta]RUO25762.1 hypothetical protein CWE09_03260 [Aliidiomarina minuta]
MAALFKVLVTFMLLLLISACATSLPVEGSGSQNLANYGSEEVEQVLIRGQTTYHDVQQHFGQPNSVSESGRAMYWNYVYRFQDPGQGISGMKSLTIVMDGRGVVTDFDFQDNSYPLE